MDRRTFLCKAGLGLVAGGLAMGGLGSACAREGKKTAVLPARGSSRVALSSDPGVWKSQGLDAARVRELLEHAIRQAFGAPDAASGLRSVLSEDDIVGIKLNCLAGPPLSPSKDLIDSLVAVLKKAGIRPSNVIFFERSERDIRKGGLEVRRSGGGPRFIGHDSPGAGYEREVSISGQAGSCLSRILTRQTTALINLGVLKDHNLAGVSAGMKNLFGVIHNPNKYHDNCCDPFVADVSAYPAVRKRLRLTIVDGLTAQCQGGPGYLPDFAWRFSGILASTDPVALDTVSWEIVEKQRKAKGLKTLEEAGRPPKWLKTAVKLGLGISDRQKIQVVGRG